MGGTVTAWETETDVVCVRDRIRTLLERVRYRPGWRIQLASWDDLPPDVAIRTDMRLALRFTLRTRDTYHPERDIVISHLRPVAVSLVAYMTDERLVRWLFEEVMAVERHEAGEWFVLDGSRRPFDPHR
jgi:hypothetical protein